ncbi:MAG: hypothetical protein MI920_01970, partial [Kiloniellales bacterium]|nr:hypothetical protein [Kiloniellales bacterium]
MSDVRFQKPVPRLNDWAERLDAALQADYDRPFAVGEHDCAIAVCRWIDAMTGLDLSAEIKARRAYRSWKGGRLVLRALLRRAGVDPSGLRDRDLLEAIAEA